MRGGFEKYVCGLLCGALLGLGSWAAVAEEAIIKLTVIADPVRTNGSPWDGYPSIDGKIIAPDSSNAPDIAVCVVMASGPPDCVWRTERHTTTSHCPDSTVCTIPGLRLPDFPVGLIFLDVDLIRHDLIDFVILVDKQASPDSIAKVEANLHTAMAKLTPGLSKRDREHRQGKARVLPLDVCVGENAKCDLTQSRFWLEKK
jgi:hypothetical protein